MLCKQPPYGGIRAIDIATGKTIWDRPLGTARTNGPFGIPSMLPITIGTPNNGGAVVTASGLIFIASATDNLIRAIDLKTGRTIWSDVLPAGGQATPMIYEANGRSEEHTSELQSLMRISYAVFCLKKKQKKKTQQ